MSERVQKAAARGGAEDVKSKPVAEPSRQDGGVVITVHGVRVEVSPELEAAVQRAYKGLLTPPPAEMTTTQAAEFLDVSRPFVVKLIKRGELPCRMVGTHRRIPYAALVKQREKMFQRAKEAAKEISQISQELGLYDLEGPPPKVR
jgi:excisionase family DNA binding protein